MPLRRPTLASVAADQIRTSIEGGEWGDRLPGGRELARVLGISRPVVYQALKELEAAGLLVGATKSARAVRRSDAAYRPPAAKVIFLSPYHVEELEELPARLAPRLGRDLADDGLRLEFVRLAKVDQGASPRSLGGLRRLHNPKAWVLYRCSPEVQRWFAEQAVPCLVIGSRPEGLKLPRIDVDYAAAGRHLLGRLKAIGIPPARTLLLTPAERLAGHGLAADALLPPELRESNLIGLVQDPDAMAGQIDAALDRRPGLIVTQRGLHAKAVIARLWARGLLCPRDLSLVSLQDSAGLAVLRPSITRYAVKQAAVFAAVTRSLGKLLKGGQAPNSGKLVLPEFVAGETLGLPA